MNTTAPHRIICVGNPYFPGDDVGPRVYEYLRSIDLPAGVVVIDGGLRGIDLLAFLEGADRIVFVDSLHGFGKPGEVIILDRETVSSETEAEYGHSGGLAYLLKMLPVLSQHPPREVYVVGAEAILLETDTASIADASLKIATGQGMPYVQ